MATIRICSIEGCGKPHQSKGFCNKHYIRFRHGIPMDRPSMGTKKELDDFVAAALASETDHCIIWPFSRFTSGHAQRKSKTQSNILHNAICETVYGPAPTPEHEAAHSCGNGHLGCINPKHVGWKTHIDNIHDKFDHGTMRRGSQLGNARFTEVDVAEMKAMLRRGESQRSVAAHFGTQQGHVSNIASGKIWKHVQ